MTVSAGAEKRRNGGCKVIIGETTRRCRGDGLMSRGGKSDEKNGWHGGRERISAKLATSARRG